MPEEKSNSLRPAGRSRVSPPFPDLLPSRKRTLLLVDDDPLCARFIGHAARECGFSAIVTISAESFKAQLRDCTPDVVVVDLAMPGADGIELLRYLASNNCTALILIISGFDQRVVECALRLGEALGLNMGRPLTKPVRFEEFSSAIQQKMEGSNAASLCL